MEIALKSQDQLQQQVAWALSQILALSPRSISIKDQMESFITYYDIFVHNAFGNYFDILKEVTYSPMMSEMLSYCDGQSIGYAFTRYNRLQYADENFARVIMQLFSIGMNILNSDRIPQLHVDGNLICSYFDSSSPLALKICNNNSNNRNVPCEYPPKVVLDKELTCGGVEWSFNDLQPVKLESDIWYEYVHPACQECQIHSKKF
jgi:hypothetical protein